MAEIIARRCDASAAELLYDDMVSYRGYVALVGPVCRGPIAHCLALLARTRGDLGLAEEHFAEADEINTRIQAPFFSARTWLEWADLLLARGEGDDRSRAEEMLRKALDVAKRHGYAQLERRAVRALSQ
jgi:tetratricopeptide (TPR) repeat protein